MLGLPRGVAARPGWEWIAGIALCAASVAWLAYNVTTAWPYTADDAYIIFRYAQNLASGHGPTFNAGRAPVEGYTTFLWMVIAVIPQLLHVDALVFAKVAEVLLTIGYLAVTAIFAGSLAIGRRKERRMLVAGIAAILVAAPYATSVHAVSGMGTSLGILLATTLLWRVTAIAESGLTWKKSASIGALALLLGLARPEGHVLAIVALGSMLLFLPRSKCVATSLVLFATYAVPSLAYFTWRCRFYGHLFPIPFYVKVANQRLLSGLPDVVHWLGYLGVHLGIILVLALAKERRRLAPACAGVVALTAVLAVPAHYVGFAYRYFYPTFPCVCAIAALGLGLLLDLVQRAGEPMPDLRRRAAVWWAILAVVVSGLLIDYRRDRAEFRAYSASVERAHMVLAQKLRAIRRPGTDPVVATSEAGMIPYVSGWTAIDTFGLNDASIGIDWTHDPDLVWRNHPDVVVVASRRDAEFVPANGDFEADLLRRSRREGMVVAHVLPCIDGSYYLWVLASPDTYLGRRLTSW